MAIQKNFYQDFTERRENKYKPITIKNTVDNSNGIMYNENKKSTPSITPVTDFASKWKEDNKDLFKYAGDSAKESMEKGLKEAPDYMQDADEGTYFSDVQTASVKRNLAQDSNNDKLHQSALMEMIGHLSKDNKDDYLKHAQPIQKYIDAKDEFDFKHNNYTTTKYIDTTPDENVRQLQRKLNEAGFTDKFGLPIREDGLYGGKTAYANDSKKAVEESNTTANVETYSADTTSTTDNVAEQTNTEQSTSQRVGNRANLPSRGQISRTTTAINNVNTNSFDYNTRLSYNQTYDKKVEILQDRLVQLGYLDMSAGAWGYYGSKTIEAVNRYKKDNGLGNTGKDEGVVGKDTWKSLGLIYRTQEDIDIGVEIVTIDRKQYKDVSVPINNALNRDKYIFAKNANDLDWFKKQVGDDGPWNIKKCENEVSTWESTIGSSFPGHESTVILYGHKVSVENIGNITYGYLGKAAKLSDAILYAGSAYNDIRNHGLSNIDGERVDRYWISVGIEWYKNTKKQKGL